MNPSETIQAIEAHLSWYHTKGSGAHVPELLDHQDRLAIHSYRLAEMAGDQKQDFNSCYYMRKISISKQTQAIIFEKKTSKAQAEIEATNENAEKIELELISEGQAFKYDLLLKQVNRVLSAMQQRISYLKQEKDQTK